MLIFYSDLCIGHSGNLQKLANLLMYSRRSIIRTFKENSKKFVISRVPYIERFYKSLISQGEQTFVWYIESSYYREFALSSAYCTQIKNHHYDIQNNLTMFQTTATILYSFWKRKQMINFLRVHKRFKVNSVMLQYLWKKIFNQKWKMSEKKTGKVL